MKSKLLVLLSTAVLVLMAGAAAASEQWFGQSPEEAEAPLAVADVLADSDALMDQSLTITGRMTDVCTGRGCWAVFEDNGEMLRVKVRDHNFAIPADLRGPAVAHGVLSKVEVSPAYAQRMVEKYGADPIVLERLYELQLVADGVRFLGDS